MSSYATHALIGAVGGLALVRAVPSLSDALFASTVPPVVGQVVIIGASAVLAIMPDLDEPNSFIGQRVQAACTALGAILAALVGLASEATPSLAIGAGFAGLFAGWLAGFVLLRAFRYAAGGHRFATHSLVVAAALAIMAGVLWKLVGVAWAVLPAALAWAIVLHLPGDLVTPGGVAIGYPLSRQRFSILPAPLSRIGEPIVVVLALLVGGGLLRNGGF